MARMAGGSGRSCSTLRAWHMLLNNLPPPRPCPQISCELGDPYEVPEQTPMVWYLALRAADAFKTRNGRYPGEEDDQVQQ